MPTNHGLCAVWVTVLVATSGREGSNAKENSNYAAGDNIIYSL